MLSQALEPNAFFVAMLICLPAVLMASARSSWLIDYLFFVVALNRGVRRYIDYQNGYFNQFSPISLTPIIVVGLTALVILLDMNRPGIRLDKPVRKLIGIYATATAMAFVVGFVNSKFAAVYALGDYLVPIGLIGFGAMYINRADVINRWCNSVALSALVVAIYGLYQFYTIPPWDAFWVRSVKFVGYLGLLEPTKMTLFSTMAERGPCAAYLCGSLIMLALRPTTLGAFRWPAAAVILIAMLFTYARTSIIQLTVACILYPIINRGKGILPIILVTVLFATMGESVLEKIPGIRSVFKRVSTLGNVQEDGSFKGRITLLRMALTQSMSKPLGLGIGSQGLGSRVSASKSQGIPDSSGYTETLSVYGWIGFLMVAYLLYQLWSNSQELMDAKTNDKNIFLFRAWFLSGLVAMLSGNWMFSATFFWVLAGYCVGRMSELQTKRESQKMLDSSSSNDRRRIVKNHGKPGASRLGFE